MQVCYEKQLKKQFVAITKQININKKRRSNDNANMDLDKKGHTQI